MPILKFLEHLVVQLGTVTNEEEDYLSFVKKLREEWLLLTQKEMSRTF